MPGGSAGPRQAAPRWVAVLIAALAVTSALASAPAQDPPGPPDGAVVHVTPYPLPADDSGGPLRVAPVTAADGVDYYLWDVQVVKPTGDGAWAPVPLDVRDVHVTVAPVGDAVNASTWGSGTGDAFAFAGDATRLLVSAPAAAVRPADDRPVTITARAGDHEGTFNPVKTEMPAVLADALDPVATPLRLDADSMGVFAFSVGLAITPVGDAAFDVTVEALSPLVEPTTLTTTHGTRSVTLDASRPATISFAGDPVGAVVRSASTRFSLPETVTFGDPTAKFLLCRSGIKCLTSLTQVLSLVDVTADGGPSVSPPGEPLAYAWEWGDGADGSGRVVEHAWARAGLYTLTLTVTDASGRSDAASLPVTVLNRDPSGHILVSPDPAHRAADVTLFAVADDPDGTITKYTWYLDGGKPPGFASGHQLTIPGPALALGEHSVLVLVRDDAGATAVLTTTFTVVNLPPVAAGITDRVFVQPGVPVQFGDASDDPDGDLVSWFWDFGDGTNSTAPNPTHAYAAEGVYVPRLNVTDAVGVNATVALAPLTVDGTRPTLTVTDPAIPQSGWFTNRVRLGVTAADDVTARPALDVRVNGAPRTLVLGGLTVEEEGANLVQVTARDHAGNAVTAVRTVPVDREAPTYTFETPWPIATGKERLEVHASDAASGVVRITLVLDQSEVLAVHEGPGPLVHQWDASRVLPGRHVLTVHVDDAAGHRTTRGHNVLTFGIPGVSFGGLLP